MNRRGFLLSSALALWPAALLAATLDPLTVPIERSPVRSTHLASVGYDEPARVLEIEFQNGAIYRYLDVPPAVVTALREADSKGRYFARAVRDHFPCRLVKKARS